VEFCIVPDPSGHVLPTGVELDKKSRLQIFGQLQSPQWTLRCLRSRIQLFAVLYKPQEGGWVHGVPELVTTKVRMRWAS
jgi:hypothetical protein